MMRPATTVLSASAATALLFGFLGRTVESDALYLMAGIAFLVAIGAGIALTPWVRNRPWPRKMEGLFPKVERGDRLDPHTGERR